MSPAHRTCSTPGCGGPAVWGSLCWLCAHDPENNSARPQVPTRHDASFSLVTAGAHDEDLRVLQGCNVLVLGHSAIPFRRPRHVSVEQFQGAIDRALGR